MILIRLRDNFWKLQIALKAMLGSLFFTVASGATWPVPGAQLIKRSEMNGRRVIGSGTEKKEAGLGRLRPPLFFSLSYYNCASFT